MIDPSYLPILVTGASGNLGRLIIGNLLDYYKVPADKIIATTRNPESIADFASRGVIVRYADLDEPDSLLKAFRGVKRLLMISTIPGMPIVEGLRLRQHFAGIDAAKEAGVEHFLYTSAPNPEPGTPAFWKDDHYLTEQKLIQSGMKWTILRHWEWPEWHLEEVWKPAMESGVYLDVTKGGRVNHIIREDTACADAGALVSDVSVNRRFDVTGEQPHSVAEIMSILTDITGKKIEVRPSDFTELEQSLKSNGKTTPVAIPFVLAFIKAVQRGLYGGKSDAVEELTGKPPTTLRESLLQLLEQ